MTENEAIEILDGKTREQALYQYESNDRPYVIAQAEYIAIKALQELQQYRELGTVEECRETRERQIPKKCKYADMRYYCPECNSIIKAYYYEYCPECGQAIKRSE